LIPLSTGRKARLALHGESARTGITPPENKGAHEHPRDRQTGKNVHQFRERHATTDDEHVEPGDQEWKIIPDELPGK